jgi:HK97 family phage portal protein
MLRQRRRERIIKAALAGGLTVPSRRALTGSWLPRWIRGDYTMRNSELIFSAVSRISTTLSAMPAQLFRGSEPVQSPLNDLLRRAPNPNMTASQFFKTLEACRCTGGNAYAIKEFDANGELARLDPLDPARVTPVLETESGELWYQIQPEEGQAFLVHSYYVLHIPFISTNGYTGISPVSVLLDTLKYADGIQTFSAKQLEQGVNAAIVLEATANLGEAQKANW